MMNPFQNSARVRLTSFSPVQGCFVLLLLCDWFRFVVVVVVVVAVVKCQTVQNSEYFTFSSEHHHYRMKNEK